MPAPTLDLDALLRARSIPTNTRNNRVMVIGDSISNHNSYMAGGNTRYMAYGALPWAAYLGRQRFYFSATSNYGVPGSNTNDVLAALPAQLAADTSGTVLVDCLTNDGPNNLTYTQSVSNYTEILRLIREAGKLAVCFVPRPRDKTASGLTMSDATARAHQARRNYVMGLHNPAAGVYVVDSSRFTADRTSVNGAQLSGMTYDGLHPTQLGSYWDGVALAQLFGIGDGPGLFPPRPRALYQAVNAYHATDNPLGALNANPLMAGGTTNATSWSSNVSAGVTATLSKVDRAAVAPTATTTGSPASVWQQVVLGGTATGTGLIYPAYQNPVTAANLAVGDVVEGWCEFEMDAGLTGISGLGLCITDNTSFLRSSTFESTSDVNTFTMPPYAHTGLMRTPPFTLTSTGIRFGIACTAVNGAAVSATFRVANAILRKVSSTGV